MRRLFTAVSMLALFVAGCSEEPRSREEIFKAQQAVDTLYFTADGRELIAPGAERGMTVDEATGELAFAAYQCNNPDCPEREGDEPFLFPLPDPFAYVDEAGKPAIRQPVTEEDFETFDEFIEKKCPACLETRDIDSETPEQRQQYQSYVTRHITPEAREQLAELEAELKRIIEFSQSPE